MKTIIYPIDFGTMKAKMVERQYSDFQEFRRDVEVVLKNCQLFNDERSELYKASVKLENFFREKLREYGFTEGMIRIK